MNRDALLAMFVAFPERVAVAGRAAAGQPVPTGEWGPAEVVRHLLAVEDVVWHARLARVAAEDDPHWPWIEPGLAPGFDGAPLDEILAAFAAARAATVDTLRALDETGWARSGVHATYGVLDVEGLIRIAVDHDEEHLTWVRRLIEATAPGH